LLNLYRYPEKAREDLLKALLKISGRCGFLIKRHLNTNAIVKR